MVGGSFYIYSGGGVNILCFFYYFEFFFDSFLFVFEGNSINRVGYFYGGEY